MTLFFTPILIIFTLFWVISEKYKNIKIIALSFILGFGLAAFYILPSFLEKDLVQIDNLTRLELDFRAHFTTINQLFFDRNWGYGASFPGPNDTISFQIGLPHWLLGLAALFFIAAFIKRKISKFALILFIIFAGAIFMTHTRAAFIWEKIGILRFAQFPWRFLSVVIFAVSLLGGYLITLLPKSFAKYMALALCLLTILLNWTFFKPDIIYSNIGDAEKLSGMLWEEQQRAAILDYLPKDAAEPREKAQFNPLIISGNAQINNFIVKSNKWSFSIMVEEDARIEVPIFDFPKWEVRANNKMIEYDNRNYVRRIAFNLKRGEYYIEGKFKNTFIRTLGNTITVFSFVVLIILIFYGKNRKFFK